MIVLLACPVGAAAQSSDRQRSLFDEFRIGMLAHDIEHGGDSLDAGLTSAGIRFDYALK